MARPLAVAAFLGNPKIVEASELCWGNKCSTHCRTAAQRQESFLLGHAPLTAHENSEFAFSSVQATQNTKLLVYRVDVRGKGEKTTKHNNNNKDYFPGVLEDTLTPNTPDQQTPRFRKMPEHPGQSVFLGCHRSAPPALCGRSRCPNGCVGIRSFSFFPAAVFPVACVSPSDLMWVSVLALQLRVAAQPRREHCANREISLSNSILPASKASQDQ